MTRILGTLIAALLVVFGCAPSVPAPVSVPDEPAATYTDDAAVYDAPSDDADSKLGSPVRTYDQASYNAVNCWSRGALVRQAAGEGLSITARTYRATLAPVARAIATTEVESVPVDADLAPLQQAVGAANSGLTSDLAALADANVVNSGKTVIGSYPGYIASAEARGASYFSIGDKWEALVARGQDPWALNQHFLDGRIAVGDSVYSTVPKASINPGSYLARETQYLQENGYQWVNQWALKPSG